MAQTKPDYSKFKPADLRRLATIANKMQDISLIFNTIQGRIQKAIYENGKTTKDEKFYVATEISLMMDHLVEVSKNFVELSD